MKLTMTVPEELKLNGEWFDPIKEEVCQDQHRVAFYEGGHESEAYPCEGCEYMKECHPNN